MLPLEQMLDIRLLINDRKAYQTANVFGYIAYSERNPFMVKVLRDNDFWQSLNVRTEGWILYAIKPDSFFYGGGNADYIDRCLELKPDQNPHLVIINIGPEQRMMQRVYPICGESVDEIYRSIERLVRIITDTVKKIHPDYLGSTNVSREVISSLDAELAIKRWRRVSSGLSHLVEYLINKH